MALNGVSDELRNWLAISNTREKLSSFFTCGDMVFLSGGNPYKALQLTQKSSIIGRR